MNPSAPDNAKLEAMLRRPPAAPLDDAAFCQRVLSALPSRQAPRVSPPYRRMLFCLGGTAVGSLIALVGILSQPGLSEGVSAALIATRNAGETLIDPVFGLALGVSVLSLLYAFRSSLRTVVSPVVARG